MANMGYCRFQNTVKDAEDCEDHIFDEELSEEEANARARFILLCKRIALDFEFEDDEDTEE